VPDGRTFYSHNTIDSGYAFLSDYQILSTPLDDGGRHPICHFCKNEAVQFPTPYWEKGHVETLDDLPDLLIALAYNVEKQTEADNLFHATRSAQPARAGEDLSDFVAFRKAYDQWQLDMALALDMQSYHETIRKVLGRVLRSLLLFNEPVRYAGHRFTMYDALTGDVGFRVEPITS